jgi:ParB family chromosome partitioning protein
MEQIQHFPIDELHCVPQIREQLNPELVQQIAQSFQTVGQLQPLRVRLDEGRRLVVDGHHRLAAAPLAAFKTLACIVENQPLDEGEVIQRQLISNCQRESVKPLEAARAIQRLMERTGWKAGQAGASIGFSNPKVSRLLALLSLPEAITEQVESGSISASAAYELTRVEDAAQQAELAQQMAAGELTRDGVSGARKATKRAASATVEKQPCRVTAILGESRTITVSSDSLTLEKFIALIEELLAKARRERSRGTELSTFISLLKDQARAK